MKTLVKPLITALLIAGANAAAIADMRIDRAIVYFDAEQTPRQDVEVSNQADDNLYLQVDVEEVVNPGLANEKRETITDFEKLGFIASPVKSIVAPHGKRRIRLLNLKGPGELEKIYRVTFKPVAKKFKANTSKLKLLVAYQSLVIVRPTDAKAQIDVVRKGSSIALHNSGNANVYLEDGKACDKSGKNCRALEGKRMYADNRYELDVSDGKTQISFTLNNGKKSKTKIFDL